MMTTARNLPYTSAVPVFVSGNQSFTTVCAGESHSCALELLGKAWCWGFGSYGGLGSGSNKDSAVPVEVAGGHAFRSITCGGGHTCAVDGEGKAWCWGQNKSGQLGTGTDADSSVPVQAAVGRTFTALAAGGYHTCGLDGSGSGKAVCWGSNSHGQLGAGMSAASESSISDPASYVPVEVALNPHKLISISSGAAFSCGLTPEMTAWCWGDDMDMQLGPNGNYTETTPVFVSTLQDFTAIATGSAHTCALALDQTLWCWGMSPANGMEIGAFDTPKEVGGGRKFRQVSAGFGLNCALDTTAAVWCMGLNMNGELGNGGTRSSTKLINVAGGHEFIYLGQAQSSHICGITTRQASAGDVNPSPLPSPAPSPPAPAAAVQPPPTDSNTTATSGSAPSSSSSSSSSSVPIGAIVGGIAGAAVVLAVLAFFALRPGKGWLRRKPAPAAAAVGDSNYVSSAGPASGAAAASPLGSAWTASHSSSAHSAASDPVLAYINSNVSSQPTSAHRQPAPLLAGSSGGGSGGLELRSDARVWEVQWAELTIVRAIGRGSFGSVYLAEWNQVPVAVKVLIGKEDINRGQLELPERVLRELQAEAAVMSHMRHPNIVQFMGLVAVPPALITEYCSRGSLYDCLAAAREQPTAAAQLTWRRRLAMAVDAGAGLLYLHRRSIIHRDVKSPNLLVDKDWNVKVADFNLSKLLEGARPEGSLTSAAATNPIWLAPEILEGGRATAASDVYSFGLVLFELLTWRLPWTLTNVTPFKLGATIRQGGRPDVPPRNQLPGPDTAGWAGLDAYLQLMRDCWAQQSADRPSFDEVVGRLRRLLADSADG
ncbi:Serine threonine- kinase CTR1 [Chlorella sorokiniana]|uniref:Serine threonine-kinase CTR1 n=1 Tax=Chlorella sorokiniana TaxID=3076 RepID=A0A2P6TPB4_CHLSO|nr:Serine threonine- kinase CTR1 [Chlorella sorokiniana]|eukprot:PRW51177.1 Serine threonine- kinase CTR1 [Chlorella sorokiniana]